MDERMDERMSEGILLFVQQKNTTRGLWRDWPRDALPLPRGDTVLLSHRRLQRDETSEGMTMSAKTRSLGLSRVWLYVIGPTGGTSCIKRLTAQPSLSSSLTPPTHPETRDTRVETTNLLLHLSPSSSSSSAPKSGFILRAAGCDCRFHGRWCQRASLDVLRS